MKESKTYYKVINEELKHHDLKYKKGLVIDPVPFNDDPEVSCVPGGIYFTDMEHITEFFNYGYWIYEVTIPDDAKVIENGIKWRADRVILGERWSKVEFYMKFKPIARKGLCLSNCVLSDDFILNNIDTWVDLERCTLPANFKITSIKGDLEIKNCKITNTLSIDNVGGDITFNTCVFPDKLIIDNVGGYIEFFKCKGLDGLTIDRNNNMLYFYQCELPDNFTERKEN